MHVSKTPFTAATDAYHWSILFATGILYSLLMVDWKGNNKLSFKWKQNWIDPMVNQQKKIDNI